MKKRGVILSTIVQKYGGTSMGSIEKIKSVAKKVILEKEKGNDQKCVGDVDHDADRNLHRRCRYVFIWNEDNNDRRFYGACPI